MRWRETRRTSGQPSAKAATPSLIHHPSPATANLPAHHRRRWRAAARPPHHGATALHAGGPGGRWVLRREARRRRHGRRPSRSGSRVQRCTVGGCCGQARAGRRAAGCCPLLGRGALARRRLLTVTVIVRAAASGAGTAAPAAPAAAPAGVGEAKAAAGGSALARPLGRRPVHCGVAAVGELRGASGRRAEGAGEWESRKAPRSARLRGMCCLRPLTSALNQLPKHSVPGPPCTGSTHQRQAALRGLAACVGEQRGGAGGGGLAGAGAAAQQAVGAGHGRQRVAHRAWEGRGEGAG